MSEQGRKEDGGKLRYDLVPVLAFEDQVKGLTYGATKYDDNNWRNVPEGRKRYMAAAMRHLQEYRKGNPWDDEQGIHHLSAAINNFSFIVEKDLQGWEDISELMEQKEEKPHNYDSCSEGWLPWYLSANKEGSPCHMCKAGEDWIQWSGGECPVVFGDNVRLRLRNGDQSAAVRAGAFVWMHTGEKYGWEIVAYSVVKG